MVGREAYQNPSLLGYVDQMLFDANADIVTPKQAVEAMFPYIEKQLSQGVYLNHIVRHMLGAFQNCKGARQWRRYLSENAFKQGAGIEVVETALSLWKPIKSIKCKVRSEFNRFSDRTFFLSI